MEPGHLPALGNIIQAGISFISRVQPWSNPIPPIWRKGRDGTGQGRGKTRGIKEPPPPQALGLCFGHCKLDFLKRKYFTDHKLSPKKREMGGKRKLCNFFFYRWKNRGDVAGAPWQELAGSSCHGALAPVLMPARCPCVFLSSASSVAFCLYFWVQFSLQQKKGEKRRPHSLARQHDLT